LHLHSNQVPASVGRSHDRLLLPDPSFLVLDIPEQLLNGQGVEKALLLQGHGSEEGRVSLVQPFKLDADVFGVEVTRLAELVGGDSDAVDAVLVGGDVGLHEGVLLLQVLNRRQVLAVVFRQQLASTS